MTGPIQNSLDSLLRSAQFARAPRQAQLLRYIVERSSAGEREALKEFAIAHEVLGRDASYDPQTDSTVRVEVSKLRSRLAEYYRENPLRDPVRIEIPKGAYVAEFHEVAPAPVAVEDAAPSTVSNAVSTTVSTTVSNAVPRRLWMRGAAGVALAMGSLGALAVGRRWVGTSVDESVTLRFRQAETAARGGASAQALAALQGLSREFAAWGAGSNPAEARFAATVFTGAAWTGGPERVQVVAAIQEAQTLTPLWSGSWVAEGAQAAVAQAAPAIAARLEQVRREARSARAANAEAARKLREALALMGVGKSSMVMTAQERERRAPLGKLLRTATLLEEALQDDPRLAVARAKLAWVYYLAAEYDGSLQDRVRETAARALEDGPCASAHYVMGYHSLFTDWKPRPAREHFAACLKLDGLNEDAARLHTDAACICGQPAAAKAVLEPLLGVLPRSPILRAAAFLLAEQENDADEMERLARESNGFDPGASLPYWQLGLARGRRGDTAGAEAAFRKGLELDPGDNRLLFAMARLRARQRLAAESRDWVRRAGFERSGPSLLALLEIEAGRLETARQWLEKATAARDIGLCYLLLEPPVRALRSHSAVAPLFERLQL